MKKNFKYALMGAIALTGAAGFTACSDNSTAEVVNNPKYDPKTGEVLVDFSFNVSTSGQPSRMSAATVQEAGQTFRGIHKALLLTYKLPANGRYVGESSVTNDKSYDLDRLMPAGYLNNPATGAAESRRVLEMSLPTGTNTLMFWGKALKDAPTEANNTDATQGAITFAPNKNLAQAAFTLKPCLSSDEKADLLVYEKLIADVFTKIVQAEASVNVTQDGKTVNKNLKWQDYVDFTGAKLVPQTYDPSTYDATASENENKLMSALGQILANLFVTLNTFGEDELRNGEGRMVATLVSDIYAVMNSVTGASATTVEELSAQAVASKVKSVIGDFFTVNNGVCTWKPVSEIGNKTSLTAAEVSTLTARNKGLDLFPDGIFRLPPGSTIMTYQAKDNEGNIVNKYDYMSTVPTYAMGNGNAFNPFNYMYPAELCYFGNSPIRVSDDAHEVNDYPEGAADWIDDENALWNNWTKNSQVISSTRAVAMQENINYGTALLKTTIRYNLGAANEMCDNKKGLHPGEDSLVITPNTGDGFELTGVLVGGQPQTVGWNYLPKGENPFVTMVYDDQLPSSTILKDGTPSSPNYTLVWDNWDETKKGGNQNKVYVALQLKNNTGKDFWGANNIIRNGSTFYIVGALDPDKNPNNNVTDEAYAQDKSMGVEWPEKYALPPYNVSSGAVTTVKERRVFIQDFVTTANFSIGPKSLKYALVSVPDLRSTQITLGLSVDLSWSQGLTFEDVVIGGDK